MRQFNYFAGNGGLGQTINMDEDVDQLEREIETVIKSKGVRAGGRVPRSGLSK